MVVSQIAHGEPEILLREGAEDLRRGALVLGVFEAEQDAAAPRPILRVAEHETYGDTLAFKADGGEIVDDCFLKRRDRLTCRLSGHAIPGSGLEEDYTGARVAQ